MVFRIFILYVYSTLHCTHYTGRAHPFDNKTDVLHNRACVSPPKLLIKVQPI